MSKHDLSYYSSNFSNLANADDQAVALYASDDFFAPKERMLAAHEPEWREDVYDDHGKWMDGWESRRKREHGHDHCIVRLSGPGNISAVDIYTRYFTGNFPPVASLDACLREQDPDNHTQWTEILSPQPISGDSHNLFDIDSEPTWSHLRLNIYPDGGVARLRVYGRPNE